MSLVRTVQRFAVRHRLWRTDTGVIAAVSGGSDSVAMLRLLHDFHQRDLLRVIAVAHLNHALRAEADADAAFCEALAARLGMAFVSTRVDVAARARDRRQSVEVAGRHARRAFLDAVRADYGADCIATAHTEDDQAETVLLRVIRGAGTRGVGGIAPLRGRRIRPVLCTTRARLRRYLVSLDQEWREDVTNADLTTPRNRVRHELLPYLITHFNPSIRRALVRLADGARHDDGLLGRLAAAASASALARDGAEVILDGLAVRALPAALQRRVAMHALTAAGSPAPSHTAVAALLAVARGEAAAADLSAVRAEHFAGNVVLVSKTRRAARIPQHECLELSVPGEVRTPGGWLLHADRLAVPSPLAPRDDVAQIDAATITGGLWVRGRRPGDRIRPVGLGGQKKLQDLLVDHKVRRDERDAVPVVTDTTGRIVWVAGHALGEAFRVTERTKGVIILKLRRF